METNGVKLSERYQLNMSNYSWCHGTKCHTSHTLDRVRGSKGSKVLRTRKIKENNWNHDRWTKYFCSQSCMYNFIEKHMQRIVAIAPRTEALETPIEIETFTRTDYFGKPYTDKTIKERVDTIAE